MVKVGAMGTHGPFIFRGYNLYIGGFKTFIFPWVVGGPRVVTIGTCFKEDSFHRNFSGTANRQRKSKQSSGAFYPVWRGEDGGRCSCKPKKTGRLSTLLRAGKVFFRTPCLQPLK